MNFAEVIKNTITLAEVVETYTGDKLAKGKMQCPFHNEKTASFTVFDNNTFYCFGCGATGDLFDFTKRLFNINFGQAILRLNNDFALHLPITGKFDRNEALKAQKALAEKREAEALKREKAVSDYWEQFDLVMFYEKCIKECKPLSPDDQIISPLFVSALQNIDYAKYKLSILEDERRRLCG